MSIKQLLEKIADNLEKAAMQDRLWTIRDIAQYTGYHENFVYPLKDRTDFPRPIQIGKHPRWKPEEVKKWAEKQRG